VLGRVAVKDLLPQGSVIMLLGCSNADPARIANLPTQWSVTSAVS